MISLAESVYRPLSSAECFFLTGTSVSEVHFSYDRAFFVPEFGWASDFTLSLPKTDTGFDCTVTLGGETEKIFFRDNRNVFMMSAA